MAELVPRARAGAGARKADIALTIDAEEADRLELSLDIIEALAATPALAGWQGLGLAVQAYQKRACRVIDWLADLARRHDRRLMVRLVKGAYWDSEIKRARSAGSPTIRSSPARSRPTSPISPAPRDCSPPSDALLPAVRHPQRPHAGRDPGDGRRRRDFEFQRLHGMGEALYDVVEPKSRRALPSHLCAGRQPQGPAALSRAPPARERRQHLASSTTWPTPTCRWTS